MRHQERSPRLTLPVGQWLLLLRVIFLDATRLNGLRWHIPLQVPALSPRLKDAKPKSLSQWS
jgi:hypothetical protein